MDTKKYLLFSAFLAAILVQGATVASIIGPNAFESAVQNAYNGDGTPVYKGEFDLYDKEPYHGFRATDIDPRMFGSKVADGDSDIGKMLYDFDLQPVIAYWDVGLIKSEFDPDDIVYLHFNDGNISTEVGDVRLTRYDNHLPGSKVAAHDIDVSKSLTGFPEGWKIVFIDQYGSKGYDLMDPVYFHVNGDSTQIDRMDLRLSHFANGPGGTLVDGHDLDRGLPFSRLPCRVRFYNVDGNMRSDGVPLYNEPDLVYLDLSVEETHGIVVVNDIRLS